MKKVILTILALMSMTLSAYSLPTNPDCSSGEDKSIWYSESQRMVVETHCDDIDIPRLETTDESDEAYSEAKKEYLQAYYNDKQ